MSVRASAMIFSGLLPGGYMITSFLGSLKTVIGIGPSRLHSVGRLEPDARVSWHEY